MRKSESKEGKGYLSDLSLWFLLWAFMPVHCYKIQFLKLSSVYYI